MRSSKGFTLIEVLITAAIIFVLASIGLPFAQITVQRAKEAELRRTLREVRDALDAYKRAADEGRIARLADESGYPQRLALLVEGVADAKSASGSKMFFLRAMPRDPMNSNAGLVPERTWGLRSYDSPHQEPRPGRDVYDIYSLSPGIGLNGIPYRQW